MRARVALCVGNPGNFDGCLSFPSGHMLPNKARLARGSGTILPGHSLNEVTRSLAHICAGFDGYSVLGARLQGGKLGPSHIGVLNWGITF